MSSQQYPEGRYEFEIVGQEIGKSKEKGTPFIAIHIQPYVYHDIHGDTDTQNGPRRTIYFWITPKTIEYLERDLRGLGYEDEDIIVERIQPGHADHVSFVGKRFSGKCEHEPYDGKMQERWSGYFTQKASGEPLGVSEFASVNDLFRRGKKASRPSTSAARPASNPPTTLREQATEAFAPLGGAKKPVDDLPF